MNALVTMAREAHRNVLKHMRLAGHFRAQRAELVTRLHDEGHSYKQIAEQTGMSRELVIKIVQGRRSLGVRG